MAFIIDFITGAMLPVINKSGDQLPGNYDVGADGAIRGGQTAFNTGKGFFLGASAGTYKFSVGDPAGNHLTWDGTNLAITGTLTATLGAIGGWNIGATALTSGAGVNTVGLDSGGVNPAIYAGSATPGSAPFRVTKTGDLFASSATITGSITTGLGSSIDGTYITVASITGSKLTNATITAVQIASATILGSNIAAATIAGLNLVDGTITATQIATATILGSNIAAATITASNIQNQTITATQIANLTITASQIANLTITAGQIANATITGAKIDSATITGGNIAAATITGSNVAGGTITGSNIAGSTITGANIQNSTITGGLIANTTITGSNLVNATITATQIASGTITATQIAASTITGSNIAATTITASNLSISTLSAITADMGSLTAGSIVIGTINKIWLNDSSDGTLAIGGNVKGSAPFSVTAAGALTATGVTITGALTTGTSSSIDGQYLVALSVTAAKIAANTITASQIAAATITSTQIAAGTITGSNIAATTISASNIVANTITASQIAAATITTTQIAASTITGSNIAAGTITGTNIAASTITAGLINVSTLAAIQANIGAATISDVLTIGSSGGIYQGSGTFASPTTGLKIYNSGGIGLLEMWGSNTKQVYFDTSGNLQAGGGAVKLDAQGLTIAGDGTAWVSWTPNSNRSISMIGSTVAIGGPHYYIDLSDGANTYEMSLGVSGFIFGVVKAPPNVKNLLLLDDAGHLYLYGNLYSGNQTTRYISDDGARTTVSGSLAVLGSTLRIGSTSSYFFGSGTGIGFNVAPAVPFQINVGSQVNIGFRPGSDFGGGYSGAAIDSIDNTAGIHNMLVMSGNPIVMRGGNVGIGTTSPNKALLQISGSVLNNNGNYGYLISNGTTGTSNGNGFNSIYASDRIVAWEFDAYSDRRIKTDVCNLPNALEILRGLNVVAYNKMTKNGGLLGEMGLIGQEAIKTFPLAVRVGVGEVPCSDGEWVDVNDFHHINYQTVSMLSIQAIQELDALVNRQSAEIAELKAKLN